jgi:hypothetical protein
MRQGRRIGDDRASSTNRHWQTVDTAVFMGMGATRLALPRLPATKQLEQATNVERGSLDALPWTKRSTYWLASREVVAILG